MNLPEPLFFTTKEAAYQAAEDLSQLEYAVEIVNHGNTLVVVTKEDFHVSTNPR